jgi:hypothetical protein
MLLFLLRYSPYVMTPPIESGGRVKTLVLLEFSIPFQAPQAHVEMNTGRPIDNNEDEPVKRIMGILEPVSV